MDKIGEFRTEEEARRQATEHERLMHGGREICSMEVLDDGWVVVHCPECKPDPWKK